MDLNKRTFVYFFIVISIISVITMNSFVSCSELKGGVDADKTIINLISDTSSSSSESSSSSSSSGGGGSGDSSVTNIYNTYVTKSKEGEKEEDKTEEGKEIKLGKSGITGGVIGSSLLAGGQITFIMAILCGTFIIFIIVRNRTFKLKKKVK